MGTNKRSNPLTIHHLVPRVRLTTYYYFGFNLPRNKLRLREKRHAAWHKLFNQKTLNEVIKYLRSSVQPIGYKTADWIEVFKTKTPRQAAQLLERVRIVVRKEFRTFEFEPTLRNKIRSLSRKKHTSAVILYLTTRFNGKMKQVHEHFKAP